MCSNYTVEEVVSSMKDQDQEAVKRRFTSYCYLENVNTVKKREGLYMSLMQIVADNFDVNLKKVIHNMPKIERKRPSITYDSAILFSRRNVEDEDRDDLFGVPEEIEEVV